MGCGVVPGNVYALSGCHCRPHSSSINSRSSIGMIDCFMRIEDRLFDRGWVRSAMATRKCGNIYFSKYLMAVRKFTNVSISKCFCTSVNIDGRFT